MSSTQHDCHVTALQPHKTCTLNAQKIANGDNKIALKQPLMDFPIKTAVSGFYRGFTKDVTITAKILVGALIILAVAFPYQAASVLVSINRSILAIFSYWYVYARRFSSFFALG
jgi:choline/glycine/proline betaine transport protein